MEMFAEVFRIVEYKYHKIAIMTDDSACMLDNGIADFELPSKQNVALGYRHLIPDDAHKARLGDIFFFYCK